MAASGGPAPMTPPADPQAELIKSAEEAIRNFRYMEIQAQPAIDKYKVAHHGLSPIDRFNTPAVLSKKIEEVNAKMAIPPMPAGADLKEIKEQMAAMDYSAKVAIHNFALGHPLEKDKLKDCIEKVADELKKLDDPLKAQEEKLEKEIKDSKTSDPAKEADLKKVKDERQAIKVQSDAVKGIDPGALNEEIKKIKEAAEKQEAKLANLSARAKQVEMVFNLTKNGNDTAVIWKPLYDPKIDTLDTMVPVSMGTDKDPLLDKLQKSKAEVFENEASKVSVRISEEAGKIVYRPLLRKDDRDFEKGWKKTLEFIALKTDAAKYGVDLNVNLSVVRDSPVALKAALKVIAGLIDHAKDPLNLKLNILPNVLEAAMLLPEKDKALKDKILKAAELAQKEKDNEQKLKANIKPDDEYKRKMISEHHKEIKVEFKSSIPSDLKRAESDAITEGVKKDLEEINKRQAELKNALNEIHEQLGKASPVTKEKLQELLAVVETSMRNLQGAAENCKKAIASLPATPERESLMSQAAKAGIDATDFQLNDVALARAQEVSTRSWDERVAFYKNSLGIMGAATATMTTATTTTTMTSAELHAVLNYNANDIRSSARDLMSAVNEVKSLAENMGSPPDTKKVEDLKGLVEDIRRARDDIDTRQQRFNELVNKNDSMGNPLLTDQEKQVHMAVIKTANQYVRELDLTDVCDKLGMTRVGPLGPPVTAPTPGAAAPRI